MWRDPLDELIEELEAALPSRPLEMDPSSFFVDLQRYVSLALYGSDQERVRAERAPWYQRVEQYFAERATKQPQHDAAICLCGADEDAEHAPDCPFANQTSR